MRRGFARVRQLALGAFSGSAPAAVDTSQDIQSTASEVGVLAAFLKG